MTVLGFFYTAINARVDEKNLFGSINVTSTPTIESVEKKDLTGAGMTETIGIRFKYETKYEQAGEIILSGEVIYKVDDAKKAEKMWKDSKRMDDEIAVDVLNFILRRCVAKTIELSDVLRLPPPVQFPVITKQPKAKKE